MKFYFCETCGERVTEEDLARGEGRNKALRGVYCNECAAGVTTLHDIPAEEKRSLTELVAERKRARLRGSAQNSEDTESPHHRSSGATIQTASGRAIRQTEPPIAHMHDYLRWLLFISIGAVAGFLTLFFLWPRDGKRTRTPKAHSMPKAPAKARAGNSHSDDDKKR